MEHTWEVLEPSFKKINVHCVVSCEPLTNGNLNGVGVAVRDEWGPLIWGGFGPMNSHNDRHSGGLCSSSNLKMGDDSHRDGAR